MRSTLLKRVAIGYVLLFPIVLYWDAAVFVKKDLLNKKGSAWLKKETRYGIEGTSELANNQYGGTAYTFGGMRYVLPLHEVAYAFPLGNVHGGIHIAFRSGMKISSYGSYDWRRESAQDLEKEGRLSRWMMQALMPSAATRYEFDDMIYRTDERDITESSSLFRDLRTIAKLICKAIMKPSSEVPQLRRVHTSHLVGHLYKHKEDALILQASMPDGPRAVNIVIKNPDEKIWPALLGSVQFADSNQPVRANAAGTGAAMEAIQEIASTTPAKSTSLQLLDLYRQFKWQRAGQIWAKRVVTLFPETKGEVMKHYPEFFQ